MAEVELDQQIQSCNLELIDYRPVPYIIAELGGLATAFYGAVNNNSAEIAGGFGFTIVVGIIGVSKFLRANQNPPN